MVKDGGGTDDGGVNAIPQSRGEASAGLLKASRAGDLKSLKYFIETGLADVNAMNQNGLSGLHLASKEGYLEVVSELIRNGANVNSRTLKGNAPLHVAALAGHEDIVKILVKNGAKVNVQSQMGFSPLYMASQENHPEIVQFLLDNNADPNITTEDGYTPLSVAIQQGHNKIASMLMDYDRKGGKVRLPALHVAAKKNDVEAAVLLLGDPKDTQSDRQKDRAAIKKAVDETTRTGFTALHIASHYGSDAVAQILVDHEANVNFPAKNEITPLHVASKWGKAHMVSLLADSGADLNCKTKDGLTPLHCAARSGFDTVLEILLARGADSGARTRNGLTALHCASQGDHLTSVAVLLKYRANIEDVTMDYLTALHVAAHCGNHNIVQLLLDNNCQIDARALNGFTALHVACKKNRIRVIEILLRFGANVECTTETGLTPLHVASFMGHSAVVANLLELGGAKTENVTSRGETALHLAARAEQHDVMRVLLRHNADPNSCAKEQQTPLHVCARLGNVEGVKLLLDHGADIDAKTKDSYTPLHIAVKESHEPVVRVLLEQGAKHGIKTSKGFSPLHVAAKYGNKELASLLLSNGANPSLKGRNGLTPLHVATHYNKPGVAKVLIDSGASPHDTAKNGYSPLHIAAKRNHLDLAILLIDSGAKPNAESKNGFTPLHLASQENHTEMVSFLLSQGSKVNFASRNGLSSMHLAAQEDHVPVAEILVEYKAQLDPETKAGYTPLHTACHFGQIKMIRFLLEHGVSVNATTRMGYTPLHVAAQQGHVLVIDILIKHRADPDKLAANGLSALAIAERMGFISVVEILNEVTTVTVARADPGDKYEMVIPEIMHENIADSDEEGPDDVFATPKPTDDITLNLAASEDNYGGQIESSEQYTPADRYKEISRLAPTRGQDLFSFESVSGRRSVTSSIGGGMGGQDPLQDEMNYMRDDSDLRHGAVTPSTASVNQRGYVFSGEFSTPGTADYDYRYMMREDSRIDSLSPYTPQSGADSLPTLSGRAPRYIQSEAEDEDLVAVRSATVESSALPLSFVADGSRADNIKCARPPAASGFLVSFVVDARGGVLHSSRHSGVRITVPAGRACMPTRITCKLVKKERLTNPPPVMEGEALATRILQMGPVGASFAGPILIEVPHYASMASKEREIVVMKSSNGRTWQEYSVQPSREQISDAIGENTVKYLESRNDYEVGRGVATILTDIIPSYYAIITRVRHDSAILDEHGGEIVSSIDPLVKTTFPQGALTKSIRVGLQVHPMHHELVQKVLEDAAYVSPVVSIEPRHRKFHQPISITLPLPTSPPTDRSTPAKRQTGSPTLRLMASIVGGMAPSQWEDVTGSSPMTVTNQTVTFTSTLSARFMLMECRNFNESAKMANALYSQSIHVPFLSKFVLFGKRRTADEARLRAFVMTDDADISKTLENQQNFVEVARSRDIEVYDDRPLFIDAVGNLVPHSFKSDGNPPIKLSLHFRALHENRLAFNVRVRDPSSDPTGQVIFIGEPLPNRASGPQQLRVNPSCVLNVTLPELSERKTPIRSSNGNSNQRTPGMDLSGARASQLFKIKKGRGIMTKAELHLEDIALDVDEEWTRLAAELNFSDRDIKMIDETGGSNSEKAATMLHAWMEGYSDGRSGAVSDLEAALERIGREDIVYGHMRDVSEQDDFRTSTDVSEIGDVRGGYQNGVGLIHDIEQNLEIIERGISIIPERPTDNIPPTSLNYTNQNIDRIQTELPIVSPDRATNEMTDTYDDETSDIMAESMEDLKDDRGTRTPDKSIDINEQRYSSERKQSREGDMKWGDVEMNEDVIRITAEIPEISENSITSSSAANEPDQPVYDDNEYGLRKGSFYDETSRIDERNESESQSDNFEAETQPRYSESSLQFQMEQEPEPEPEEDKSQQNEYPEDLQGNNQDDKSPQDEFEPEENESQLNEYQEEGDRQDDNNQDGEFLQGSFQRVEPWQPEPEGQNEDPYRNSFIKDDDSLVEDSPVNEREEPNYNEISDQLQQYDSLRENEETNEEELEKSKIYEDESEPCLQAETVQRVSSMPEDWVRNSEEDNDDKSSSSDHASGGEEPHKLIEPFEEDQDEFEVEIMTKAVVVKDEFQPDMLTNLDYINEPYSGEVTSHTEQENDDEGEWNREPNEEPFEEPNEEPNVDPNEEINEEPNEESNEEPNEEPNVDPNEETNEEPNEESFEQEFYPNDYSLNKNAENQESGDSYSGSSESSVRVIKERVVGDPEITRDVTETEEVLEDGTVVRKRVEKTKQRQTITNRIVTHGSYDDDEARQIAEEFASQEGEDGEDDIQTEEIEEVLDDGTIVTKKITRRTRKMFAKESPVNEEFEYE